MQLAAQRLQEEFLVATGVNADIRLPSQLSELFRAFAIATQHGNDEFPLACEETGFVRDSSRHCYITFQNFIASLHLGFRGTENSLEHGLTTSLASHMERQYSRESQIITTTHSPAIYGLRGPKIAVYRVHQEDQQTKATPVTLGDKITVDESVSNALEEELGLMEFQQQWQREYQKRLETG